MSLDKSLLSQKIKLNLKIIFTFNKREGNGASTILPKGIHLILTASKTLKSRIFARTYNLPFTRNPMQSAHRNGIKGLVHTSPGKKICGLKNQSGFVWRGLRSVSEKRVLSVGIKEKYKDVRCLNLIWVKKVKRKTQL